MHFKYFNPGPYSVTRGADEKYIFLPGWGFDGRILELLPVGLDWMGPTEFLDPGSALEDLRTDLTRLGGRITLAGWSMGGYLAIEFARLYPEVIAGLQLFSLRKNWPAREIAEMKQNLAADPVAAMKIFYRKCFLGQKEVYEAFRRRLQDHYLQEMEPAVLSRGLDYLAAAAVDTLPDVPVRLFHGSTDIIAPLDEMPSFPGIQNEVVTGAGHAVFLAEAFFRPAARKKQLVRLKFSEAAATYDEYATVQIKVAGFLAEALPSGEKVENILEIGCGTGNYTAKLVKAFPKSRLTAIDFSEPMLDMAQRKLTGTDRMNFICQDAETYLAAATEKFDLITSNAALQWFDNLSRVLADIGRLLRPGGFMLASIFGPETLRELAEALPLIFGEKLSLPSQSFPTKATMRAMLEQYFYDVEFEEVTFTRHYQSFRDLLTHIKRTGTTGWQERAPLIFTRSRLQKLDGWFAERYGGYQVTYQVYIVKGRA